MVGKRYEDLECVSVQGKKILRLGVVFDGPGHGIHYIPVLAIVTIGRMTKQRNSMSGSSSARRRESAHRESPIPKAAGRIQAHIERQIQEKGSQVMWCHHATSESTSLD